MKNEKIFEEHTYFPLHAILLFGALRAEEKLPDVLNFMRQSEAFQEFWCGDLPYQYLIWPVYHLAQQQLDALKAYVLEEDNLWSFRSLAVHVVSQVMILQPHRREECLTWFQEVLSYLIQNQDNPRLMDSHLLVDIIDQAQANQASELEPLLKEIYTRNLVPIHLHGSWEEVQEILHNPISRNVLQADADIKIVYVNLKDGKAPVAYEKLFGYEAFQARLEETRYKYSVFDFLSPDVPQDWFEE
ncbi:MAG: DUF1186 domain-containing protein, partial [Bacteroidia bacterium]|nr:DUF1186 domain-containing protein [Bacteroidia bacterium]